MAFTANTAQTHILLDTHDRVVVKWMYYSPDKVNETDVLKINVETLAHRTFDLTVANTANARFQPGDVVTGATSNASAFVAEWRLSTNTLVVVDISGNTAFTNTENITIQRTGGLVPLHLFTVPARNLEIVNLSYSIGDIAAVEIGAGGVYANSTPYVHPVVLLHDVGSYGKTGVTPNMPRTTNPALNPTGNYYVSTYAPNSISSINYMVQIEFSKIKGFAQKPVY
jgi:hypothetical protein